MSSRRPLARVVVAGLAGGAAALAASGRPWAEVAVGGLGSAGGPLIELSPTGRALSPVVPGLALAGLAAALALLVTSRLARVLTATVLMLAGAGIVVASVRAPFFLEAAVRPEIARAVGRTGVSPTELSVTAWPWLAAAGGLVMLGAGAVALIRGGRWPGMSRRYEREPAEEHAPAASREPEELWSAQDRGEDPTA